MKNPESPIIFFEGSYTQAEIKKFIINNNLRVVDLYVAQARELAKISNPFKGDAFKSKKYVDEKVQSALKSSHLNGDWIYFPWTQIILHQVKKTEYLEILTDRNIGFVSRSEQETLLSKKIGIVGLSTGSSIALGLVHSGIGSHFTLADFDRIDTSDLNRTFYDLSDVGLSKTTAISRRMYQVNPYLNIDLYSDGFLASNANEILSSQKFDILFDEASQLTPGLLIRQFSKKNKIPVITCGNLGYGVYIGIERYDINKDQKLYFGIQEDELKKYLDTNDYKGLENSQLDLMTVGNIDNDVLNVIKNESLESTESPQLFSALSLNSAIVPYLLREIFKKKITSKEIFISFYSLLKQ